MHHTCKVHDWVVFAAFLDESTIGVQCAKCGLVGRVVDPVLAEWEQAFYAPSCQYAWHFPERVTALRQDTHWYVPRISKADA